MDVHNNKIEKSDKPYQENVVNVRGVIITVVGLAVVCVVSFALMWVLQQYLDERAVATEQLSPMMLETEERLPPEPRLQSAPGFGVEGPEGRVNLELREPQAEYKVLIKKWEKAWKEGEKDPKTGAIISLPIEEAKKKVLESGEFNAAPPKSATEAEAPKPEAEKAAAATAN